MSKSKDASVPQILELISACMSFGAFPGIPWSRNALLRCLKNVSISHDISNFRASVAIKRMVKSGELELSYTKGGERQYTLVLQREDVHIVDDS
jgi:hypothetical protein